MCVATLITIRYWYVSLIVAGINVAALLSGLKLVKRDIFSNGSKWAYQKKIKALTVQLEICNGFLAVDLGYCYYFTNVSTHVFTISLCLHVSHGSIYLVHLFPISLSLFLSMESNELTSNFLTAQIVIGAHKLSFHIIAVEYDLLLCAKPKVWPIFPMIRKMKN